MNDVWEVAATCGACGERKWIVEREICGRRVGRCASCAVVRLVDRVAEGRLDLLYRDYYHGTSVAVDLERQLDNPTFAFRQRRLESLLGDRPRRILEVGCGDGNFLAFLARQGWMVMGTEFGETAGATARRHGIDVRPLDAALDAATFSVVAAYHVLEHVYWPAQWLRAVERALAPGGLLHLQVPNYGSLTRLLTGESWASWHFPQHVFLYTPATLAALLRGSGFNVRSLTTWDPWHGPGTVSASVINAARRVVTRRPPWSAEIAPIADRRSFAAPRSNAFRHAARRALTLASHAFARAEAAVGRGAVVDILASR